METKEPQYQFIVDEAELGGLESLGLMTSYAWNHDPKRLTFTLSRYKFVSKMLIGRRNVLEIGCADAFGTRIVRQHVPHVTAIDFDPIFVADVEHRMGSRWTFDVRKHDILEGPMYRGFDAVYALDVLEHIEKDKEDLFFKHAIQSMVKHGCLIIGMPSLASQPYASQQSKEGHVNCKTGPELRQLMYQHFRHVFLFSMNDEVVHTGYEPMAHYLFAIGCEQRYK